MQAGALVGVDRPTTQRTIEESADPPLLSRIPASLSGLNNCVGLGPKAGLQFVAIGRTGIDFGLDMWGELAIKPGDKLVDICPGQQGCALLTQALVELGQAQLCSKVEPVDRQRPIQRAAFAFMVPGQPVRIGEVAPKRQRIGIGLSRARKGRDGLRRSAAAQGGKPFIVGLLGERNLVHG